MPEHPLVARAVAGSLALIQALGDAGTDVPLWVRHPRRGRCRRGLSREPRPGRGLGPGPGRRPGDTRRWGGLVDLPETLDARAADPRSPSWPAPWARRTRSRYAPAGCTARRVHPRPRPGRRGGWQPPRHRPGHRRHRRARRRSPAGRRQRRRAPRADQPARRRRRRARPNSRELAELGAAVRDRRVRRRRPRPRVEALLARHPERSTPSCTPPASRERPFDQLDPGRLRRVCSRPRSTGAVNLDDRWPATWTRSSCSPRCRGVWGSRPAPPTPPPTPSWTRSPSSAAPAACPPPRWPGASWAGAAWPRRARPAPNCARRAASPMPTGAGDRRHCARRSPRTTRRPRGRRRRLADVRRTASPPAVPRRCRRPPRRPGRARAGREPAGDGAGSPAAWPACPRPNATGSSSTWSGPRPPPCSATPSDAPSAPPGLPRPRLRLAHRGRAAQPAHRRDRPAAARHARLRPPHRRRPRRAPARPSSSARHRRRRAAGPSPRPRRRRRADRHRRDELPLPRRRQLPEDCGGWSPTAATRSRVPHRPGLGPRRPLRPDPDGARPTLHREGGFLDDAAEFDAGFFGISPREAARDGPAAAAAAGDLLGGLRTRRDRPAALRGSRTGVFVGTNDQDYGTGAGEFPRGLEGYLAPAARAASSPAGSPTRSGSKAPAITVDTACSSSLVALHLAAQALRQRRVRRWPWSAASP